MRVTVQVRIEPDDANDVADVSVIDVATIERRELAVDTLGLCITEAKTLLAGVQDVMVTAQAAEALRERERCDVCGRRFAHKDTRTLVDAHLVRHDPAHQSTLVVMQLWPTSDQDVLPDR